MFCIYTTYLISLACDLHKFLLGLVGRVVSGTVLP